MSAAAAAELSLTPDPPRDDRIARFVLSLFSCARSPGMTVPFGTFKNAQPVRHLSCELFEDKRRRRKPPKPLIDEFS